MNDSLIPVFLTILIAIATAGAMLFLGWFLGRVRGGRVDHSPYECGMPPFEPARGHRFSVKFYLVAMLFILFDVEAAFLYPWGVTFRDFAGNRLFVLGEMVVFLGILVVGFVYLWWRGALNWE